MLFHDRWMLDQTHSLETKQAAPSIHALDQSVLLPYCIIISLVSFACSSNHCCVAFRTPPSSTQGTLMEPSAPSETPPDGGGVGIGDLRITLTVSLLKVTAALLLPLALKLLMGGRADARRGVRGVKYGPSSSRGLSSRGLSSRGLSLMRKRVESN
mmetsp:Transcript_48569/g.96847  ORF Transcript_48569/g.96847 Transcript_48569/m.96847 type:complete len:156 (-) Transcript_48569:408-875(-)